MTERIDIKYVLKDTKANWTSFNPILSKGIMAYETDTNLIKLFDGVSDYNSLAYIGGTGGSSTPTDYASLSNKPQINSVELSGNKTLDQLGIQAKGDFAVKSTTLSGYGITDAYTKTEADGKYATKTELSNKADTSALSNYATTSALTEGLAEKADTSALPASTSLMNGTAPSVVDFAGADAEGLKTELNALLAQLKTRGVIA